MPEPFYHVWFELPSVGGHPFHIPTPLLEVYPPNNVFVFSALAEYLGSPKPKKKLRNEDGKNQKGVEKGGRPGVVLERSEIPMQFRNSAEGRLQIREQNCHAEEAAVTSNPEDPSRS